MEKIQNAHLLNSLIKKAQRYARTQFTTMGPIETGDVAQMAVIKLVQHTQYDRLPSSYLYRIVRTVAVDIARQYAREIRSR